MGYKKKTCAACGKMFFTKSSMRKFCSPECRRKVANLRIDESGQKCWNCKNATGKCSWSRELIPIKNWVANPVFLKEKDGYVRRTYEIISCPQFIHD